MKPYILEFASVGENDAHDQLPSGVYNVELGMRVVAAGGSNQLLIEDRATLAQVGTHSTKIQRDAEDESDDR